MQGSSKSTVLPITHAVAQILGGQRSPSPLPNHLSAPPSTPVSNIRTPETNDAHNETARGTVSIDSRELSTPGTPDSRNSNRRNSRNKEKHPSRHSYLLKPTLILENSGSVARDHLASERTFLAYVRTSLLLATTGVALVQLFTVASYNPDVGSALIRIRKFARPLGATLIAVGLLVLTVGVRRYFLIQTFLTKGLFPVTRFAVAGLTTILTIVIVVIFGVLVTPGH